MHGGGGHAHLRAGGPWRPEALVSSRGELTCGYEPPGAGAGN